MSELRDDQRDARDGMSKPPPAPNFRTDARIRHLTRLLTSVVPPDVDLSEKDVRQHYLEQVLIGMQERDAITWHSDLIAIFSASEQARHDLERQQQEEVTKSDPEIEARCVALRQDIEDLFNWFDVGPPRAYFEIPSEDYSGVRRFLYHVVGVISADPALAVASVYKRVAALRVLINPDAHIAAMYWRRFPDLQCFPDDKGNLAWRCSVRLCLPQVDFNSKEAREIIVVEGELYPRVDANSVISSDPLKPFDQTNITF